MSLTYEVIVVGGAHSRSCLPAIFSSGPPRDVQTHGPITADASAAEIYRTELAEAGISVRLLGAHKLTRAELAAVLNRIAVAQVRHDGDETAAADLFLLVKSMRSPHAACAENNLGLLYERQGRLKDARAALQRALRLQTRLGDPEKICLLHMNLAHVCESEGDLDAAEKFLKLALSARIKQCGPEHREVAKVLNLLGAVELKQGRVIKAQQTLTEALNILERIGTPAEDPELARAVEHLTDVYDLESPHFGLDRDHHHAEMAKTLLSLAKSYAKKEDGAHHAARGLELLQGTFGDDHAHVHKFRRDMLLEADNDGGDDQDDSELEEDPLAQATAPPDAEETEAQMRRDAEEEEEGEEEEAPAR